MIDINKIEKRAIQSFYDDGLIEIALGLLLVLLGGYFVAQALLPSGSALEGLLTVLIFILIFSSAVLINRLLRLFKRRITYPRTGYVAFKKKDPSPKRRTAAAVVAMIISASMVALFGLSPSFRALYPALNGLLFAVAVLLFANRIGLVRFFVLAGFAAVAGVALTAAGLGGFKGVGLFYLMFGAAAVVSGLGALIIFLRRNPRPAAEDAAEGPDAR